MIQPVRWTLNIPGYFNAFDNNTGNIHIRSQSGWFSVTGGYVGPFDRSMITELGVVPAGGYFGAYIISANSGDQCADAAQFALDTGNDCLWQSGVKVLNPSGPFYSGDYFYLTVDTAGVVTWNRVGTYSNASFTFANLAPNPFYFKAMGGYAYDNSAGTNIWGGLGTVDNFSAYISRYSAGGAPALLRGQGFPTGT